MTEVRGSQRDAVILSCMHPADDGRVAYRVASSLSDAGYHVSWIGPARRLSSSQPAFVNYRVYSPGRGRLGRLTHMPRTLVRALRLPRMDVAYATGPDSAVAALALRQLGRVDTVVFDVLEEYHGQQLERWTIPGLRRTVAWLAKQALRFIVRRVDLVVGVSSVVLAPFADLDKVTVIARNSPPVDFASAGEASRATPSMSMPLRLMHGKSAAHQGTRTVLQAAQRVKSTVPNLRVVVFDYFSFNDRDLSRSAFEELVRDLGLTKNIELRALVPYHEMPTILSTCSIGLIAYERRWAEISLPNRLFEYMAAGIPVVVPKYAPAMAEIVETECCGILVDATDPRTIADAVVRLATDEPLRREMGRRGREAFCSRYSWEAQFRPVIEYLASHRAVVS